MDAKSVHKEPIPGIKIVEPDEVPASDEVIIGYKLVPARPAACCVEKFVVKPKPTKMNLVGWLGVIVTAVIFWPVSCVPCCLKCSYDEYWQVPVYSKPS